MAEQKKLHADVAIACYCASARVDLCGRTHPHNQAKAKHGPNGLQPLPSRDDSDYPTDKNGRAVVIKLTSLEVYVGEAVGWGHRWSEGCICSGQQEVPSTPQIQAGNQVGCSEKDERSETEHRPWCAGTPGSKPAPLNQCLSEVCCFARSL